MYAGDGPEQIALKLINQIIMEQYIKYVHVCRYYGTIMPKYPEVVRMHMRMRLNFRCNVITVQVVFCKFSKHILL